MLESNGKIDECTKPLWSLSLRYAYCVKCGNVRTDSNPFLFNNYKNVMVTMLIGIG